jgi:arsenate reductase
MTKKIYYLKTCDTSIRIIKQLYNLIADFIFQEIKTEPITVKQLEEMKQLAGTYEALFSRRAKKYKEMGLKNEQLSEEDYKQYLLQEYTFLKRPVVIVDKEIFIGNSKKNIELLTQKLQVK